MSLLDRRRAQSERRLRRLIEESGEPMPPDEEIAEVADFFARHGQASLPMLKRAFEEMVRQKEAGQGENPSRPPATPKKKSPDPRRSP
jgi:hypothetical protein